MMTRHSSRHTTASRYRVSQWVACLGASVPLCVVGIVVASVTSIDAQRGRGAGPAAPPPTPRAAAPVDLTGHWVSVVTEDWAWRMQTPPKGDYASVPLNPQGRKVADAWTTAQDGSCLAYGAAALLRMPGRIRISWQDDQTLKIETDAGQQTRLLRFSASASPAGPRDLQGHSTAVWQVTGQQPWGSLKVVTSNMRAAWLRRNGVPYSENAMLTEYFDRFTDGKDEWFTVTTLVEDPMYLNQPFIISSNFKREPDGSKWNPTPCKAS
jgi:hypothetical protein